MKSKLGIKVKANGSLLEMVTLVRTLRKVNLLQLSILTTRSLK